MTKSKLHACIVHRCKKLESAAGQNRFSQQSAGPKIQGILINDARYFRRVYAQPGDGRSMRSQVMVARKNQEQCFNELKIQNNGQMSSRQIREYCKLDDQGMNLLKSSVNEMGLSARAHDKVLRVSRTIADMDNSSDIRFEHLSEAINYRMLDRDIWS